MIRYQLKCDEGHEFEAWFGSAAAYDDQAERGLVSCAVCGSTRVEKAPMAPALPAKANRAADRAAPEAPTKPMLSAPVPKEIAEKLSALRREIEKNSSYVGRRFAAEARAMHLGEAENRAIHGEATGDEAKALIEEGVPVAPLPFSLRRDD
ncbi:DUF1178 family protein [Pikeienuella piscinae]|uniref:DUF1178 family protein n=1 Tax=Pikeienuella piscinae TaxID=2748098 RepID=A0A7L5BUC2_9RHOB|nr:DUF1178 family protein [Pikeienuella piscinae]QIE53967.1 DUF1178 family protein [Pikeienuella piscinae]